MINPKELRIGNLIKYTGKPYPSYPLVDGIVEVEEVLRDGVNLSQGDSTLYESENIEGIPLTPEWLERFGFVKDMGGGGGLLEFENGFICFYDMDNPTLGYNESMIKGAPISLQYVHQLQNLYFTLTGQELNIKKKHDKPQ